MTYKRFIFLIIALVFWGVMFFGGQLIMFKYYPEQVSYILGGVAWAIITLRGIEIISLTADIFAPLEKKIYIKK